MIVNSRCNAVRAPRSLKPDTFAASRSLSPRRSSRRSLQRRATTADQPASKCRPQALSTAPEARLPIPSARNPANRQDRHFFSSPRGKSRLGSRSNVATSYYILTNQSETPRSCRFATNPFPPNRRSKPRHIKDRTVGDVIPITPAPVKRPLMTKATQSGDCGRIPGGGKTTILPS